MFHTVICDLLAIKYPILQGAMQGGGGVDLVAAVSEAGGLGVLPTFGGTDQKLRADIAGVRARTDKPFGVNIMPMGRGITERCAATCIELGIPIVTTGRADPGEAVVRRLKAAGIKVVRGEASAIDLQARSVRLADGSRLAYDRLVVSPGIDLNFAGVAGYSEAAAAQMPHAWKAGAQTTLLRQQLEAMPDGGTFIVAPPANPFRCPPGPYERVSLVASYFKAKKPKSKILVFDAKDNFSKQGLFQAAWESEFPGMIAWVAGKDGGKVESVDPATMTVKCGFGNQKGDVVNLIPPQRAGAIAQSAGLSGDNGWCPVDPMTFASTKAANVHVIGDASIAGAMPKSGSSANAQGKLAAGAILASLAGKPAPAPALNNICYSLVTPDYGISVTDVYQVTKDKGITTTPNAGGLSVRTPTDLGERKLEAAYARGWYRNISADSWG